MVPSVAWVRSTTTAAEVEDRLPFTPAFLEPRVPYEMRQRSDSTQVCMWVDVCEKQVNGAAGL